jgi:hypothetical protein
MLLYRARKEQRMRDWHTKTGPPGVRSFGSRVRKKVRCSTSSPSWMTRLPCLIPVLRLDTIRDLTVKVSCMKIRRKQKMLAIVHEIRVQKRGSVVSKHHARSYESALSEVGELYGIMRESKGGQVCSASQTSTHFRLKASEPISLAVPTKRLWV